MKEFLVGVLDDGRVQLSVLNSDLTDYSIITEDPDVVAAGGVLAGTVKSLAPVGVLLRLHDLASFLRRSDVRVVQDVNKAGLLGTIGTGVRKS